MSVYKLLQKLERLTKSDGQYNKIDPAFFQLTNDGYVLKPALKAKVDAQLIGGKISPEDMEKLIEARNFPIIQALANRQDLTEDQIKKIISHKDGFKYSQENSRKRGEVTENQIQLFDKLRELRGGDAINDLIGTGNDDAVNRFLVYGKPTSRHLMDVVMKRHDLSRRTMEGLIRNHQYGPEHAAELIHNPDVAIVGLGLERLGGYNDAGTIQPILEAALMKQNPELNKKLLSKKVPFSERQIKKLIDDQDIETACRAAEYTHRYPDIAKHIIDNIENYGQKNITLPEDPKSYYFSEKDLSVVGFLVQGFQENAKTLPQESADKLLEYMTDNNHPALGDRRLAYIGKFSDHVVKKLYSLPDTTEEAVGAKKAFLGSNNAEGLSSDVIQSVISNTNNNDILSLLVGRKGLSNDNIREVWAKTDDKDKAGHTFLRRLLENQQTPTDVLDSASNHLGLNEAPVPTKQSLSPSSLVALLVQHPNAGPEVTDKALSSPNPEIRQAAAKNTNATPEQIKKGISDKDKTVREYWWQHPGIKSEHLKLGLKDRAPSVRVELAKHKEMTPELLHEIMTKDKSELVRVQAAQHPNLAEHTIQYAMENDPSRIIQSFAFSHPNLGQETIDKLINKGVTTEIADKIIQRETVLSRNGFLKNKLTSDQITKIFDPVFKDLKQSIEDTKRDGVYENRNKRNWLSSVANLIAQQENAPQSVFDSMFDALPPQAKANFIMNDHNHKKRDPAYVKKGNDSHLNTMYDIYIKSRENAANDSEMTVYAYDGMRTLVKEHPDLQRLGILDKLAEVSGMILHPDLVKNPEISTDILNKIVRSTVDDGVISDALKHKNHDRLTVDTAINKVLPRDNPLDMDRYRDNHLDMDRYVVLRAASVSPHFTSEDADKLYDRTDDYDSRRAAVYSPVASESLIVRALKDPDPNIKLTAGKAISHHNPDLYNQSLDNSHEIEIHPATEKLKHLKGLIDEAGGKIHKKDLEGIGFQGIPGKLLDGTGNVTTRTIDDYLSSLPKTKFNISYDEWDGAQRHDSNHEQKVYQVNMTNDHVKQLKEQDVFDTFKWMHQMSFKSGHPVNYHTLGWVRADESQPGHIHFDELQSDFGQGTIRQIEQLKASGRMNPEEADKKSGDLKKIIKIFSGPFKNINHALFGAAHEIARKQEVTSTSMDKIEDQAKQSGMNGAMNLPGHMQFTYKQLPEDAGYNIKDKKSVMPNSQSREAELQHRKLIKSLEFLNYLKGLI